jgi:hypothetical protein
VRQAGHGPQFGTTLHALAGEVELTTGLDRRSSAATSSTLAAVLNRQLVTEERPQSP